MFIRESKTTNKKTDKVYIKHSLVESVRTERGPRQRLVMSLGKLDLDRDQWKDLALALELFLNGEHDLEHVSLYGLTKDLLAEITRQRAVIGHHQSRLTKQSEDQGKSSQKSNNKNIQAVDLNTLSVSESRSLGPELLAHDAWKSLEFTSLLSDCGFNAKEVALAAAVIWGRLIQPGSDLATCRWLRESSSLADFFDADISRVHKDRIYSIADKLLAHKDKLEEYLYQKQCDLFNHQKTLFLFDLTNFYFEGKAAKNELAKRGKSKEKRSQNALVSLALIVDEHGFPVKSEVFEGNVSEPSTLKDILKSCGLLEDKEGDLPFRPILAMDRGIATNENIALIKELKFPYTVIQRANKTSEFKDEFAKMEGFKQIRDTKNQTIHLKKIGNQVLCRSEAREEKEKAMREQKITRATKDLDKLAKSISAGRIKKISTIHERLGRIKKTYSGFDKLFELNLAKDHSALNYKIKESPAHLTGCYIIEFDGIEGNEELIWRTYTTLTQVEAAFCSMKTDLGTRPVYHQGAERTKAHLFLSILAYHLLANIEHRLVLAGKPQKWHKLRLSLQNHRRSTLQWKDEAGEINFKKLSSLPEPVHMDIYHHLAIKNPLKDIVFSRKCSNEKISSID